MEHRRLYCTGVRFYCGKMFIWTMVVLAPSAIWKTPVTMYP